MSPLRPCSSLSFWCLLNRKEWQFDMARQTESLLDVLSFTCLFSFRSINQRTGVYSQMSWMCVPYHYYSSFVSLGSVSTTSWLSLKINLIKFLKSPNVQRTLVFMENPNEFSWHDDWVSRKKECLIFNFSWKIIFSKYHFALSLLNNRTLQWKDPVRLN